MTLSYLEIYNENIRDLLNPSSGHLDLRDDRGGRNARVAGLSETEADSTEEVMGGTYVVERGKSRDEDAVLVSIAMSRSRRDFYTYKRIKFMKKM